MRWEADPDARPQSAADRAKTHALDIAGAFTLVLGRKFIDPLLVSSVEQAEMYDESAENETGGWLDRLLEYNVSTVRNTRLISLIDEIHRDRATEEIHVGVVFGARHMPAVAAHLGDPLGYVATDAEWLTVAHR
ncbi:MAG: hypothetical protein FWE35_28170 [Streptosporangiales bacterium]|nr:hypothetical protein [Streptosporangiales bacterium]